MDVKEIGPPVPLATLLSAGRVLHQTEIGVLFECRQHVVLEQQNEHKQGRQPMVISLKINFKINGYTSSRVYFKNWSNNWLNRGFTTYCVINDCIEYMKTTSLKVDLYLKQI